MSSGNGWGFGLSRALNAGSEGESPVFRASPAAFILFLVIVFVGKFLFANLFLGVLAQAYAQVSLDSRHQAAFRRSHLIRLTQLANINHQTATLIQNKELTFNPLKNRKHIEKSEGNSRKFSGGRVEGSTKDASAVRSEESCKCTY